jgi:hypothetical protein
MADTTETCGNCGAKNPAGADFCIRCHQPLTASAEEGLRESLEAQDRGGLFGAGGTQGQGAGLGLGVMGGGMLMPGDTTPDDATHHGMPPRRS